MARFMLLLRATVLCAVLAGAGLRGAVVGQEPPRTFGRAGTGFGAGVTFGAVAASYALTTGSGNACTGSGDYLQFCRLVFIGGSGLAGGLGAIIGSSTRRDAPSGRARSILLGSAAGAFVPFLVSIGACEQEEPTNPRRLCGRHGMVNPTITVAGALAGGLVGYFLGGRSSGLEVGYIGPSIGPDGAPAFQIGVRRSMSLP